jgi:nitrite reductase/ring-hydroxylating ferredoxin subunit
MAKSKGSQPIELCELSDIADSSCKSFSVKIRRKETDIFVIHKNDHVYAYQNTCPHAKVPLEWNPDQFLDEKKENIICALHGARFSIEKGECLGGPCEGVGLTPTLVKIVGKKVVLE